MKCKTWLSTSSAPVSESMTPKATGMWKGSLSGAEAVCCERSKVKVDVEGSYEDEYFTVGVPFCVYQRENCGERRSEATS